MTHTRDDTGGGLSNVNTQNSPESQQMLPKHSPKWVGILRRVEREEALIPFKRTFKQMPRVRFKSGWVKVWLPRFAQSQKRCRGFISSLSAVCTRPGREWRGEAVDHCDNIHVNGRTTGVWTQSRDSIMAFFRIGRKTDLRWNKMGWHGRSRCGLNDSRVTWQQKRSNILPMLPSSMFFHPSTAVDQLWTTNSQQPTKKPNTDL